jgi:hypothetical protein
LSNIKYMFRILLLLLISSTTFAQVVQERNARGADRIIILKDGFRVPIRDTATAPALLNYTGDSSRGGVVYDSTLQKLCFWTGVRWVCVDDAAGPGGSGVDSIYRKPGQDSIFYTINSIERAILDSTGGGGAFPSDSLAFRRVGITQRINTVGWNSIYSGFVGASAAAAARDSANFIWGIRAGNALTTGYRNIAMGRGALKTATTGHSLIAIGDSAMANGAVTQQGAIAIGQRALAAYVGGNAASQGAIAIGQDAGAAYTGSGNSAMVAIGFGALKSFVGSGNTSSSIAIGRNAAQAYTGTVNFASVFAFGDFALSNNSYTGQRNIAIGVSAGSTVTTGSDNVLIYTSGTQTISTGSRNTFINSPGQGISTSNDNVIIGAAVGKTFNNSGNTVYIGSTNQASTQGANATVIGSADAGRSTGDDIVAIGFQSLRTGATAQDEDSSTAIGFRAGATFATGTTMNRGAGVYIGYQAAAGIATSTSHTGNELIAIGVRAAVTQTAGDYNMALGRVNLANTTGSNQLAIGGNGIGWIRQDVDGSLRRTLLNATTSDVTTFTPSTALEINGTNGAVLLPRLTTAQRDALTPTDGMQIYNTTTNKFQGRAGGAWVDLH